MKTINNKIYTLNPDGISIIPILHYSEYDKLETSFIPLKEPTYIKDDCGSFHLYGDKLIYVIHSTENKNDSISIISGITHNILLTLNKSFHHDFELNDAHYIIIKKPDDHIYPLIYVASRNNNNEGVIIKIFQVKNLSINEKKLIPLLHENILINNKWSGNKVEIIDFFYDIDDEKTYNIVHYEPNYTIDYEKDVIINNELITSRRERNRMFKKIKKIEENFY